MIYLLQRTHKPILDAQEKEIVAIAKAKSSEVLREPPNYHVDDSAEESAKLDTSSGLGIRSDTQAPTIVTPLTSQAAPAQIQSRLPASALFTALAPSAAEQVASIADTAKEDLEIVDFSEMDKFVGVHLPSENSSNNTSAGVPSRNLRPLAADFFDNPVPKVDPAMSKSVDSGVWRKKVGVPSEVKNEPTVTSCDNVSMAENDILLDTLPLLESSTTKEPLGYLDTHGRIVHVPSQQTPQSQRPLRPQFREAPMSALDDTMLRIKGALVDMHSRDASTTTREQDVQSKKSALQFSPQSNPRRAPALVRQPHLGQNCSFDESREMCFVTGVERPTTPPAIGIAIPVRLPSLSRPVRPVPKLQLIAFHRPPRQANLRILTFDPPLPEMKRTWLLNDVLFRGPSVAFKGMYNYRVLLPGLRGKPLSPVTPSTKSNGMGAFGRSSIADGVTSWRRPMTSPSTNPEDIGELQSESGLNTTSRSAPPESTPPVNTVASIPKTIETPSIKFDNNAATRTRAPKMPEGSAVAFMRNSRIDVVERSPRPLVNFIVSSELDEPWLSGPVMPEPGVTATSRVVHSPLVTKTELRHDQIKSPSNGTLETVKEQVSTKVDGKSSNEPVV